MSFTHVFFRRDRIDGDLEHVAAEAVASLEGGAAPSSMGDPFVRGSSFAARSRDELATIFGADFAARVMEAPEKRWSGPIPSSFGWHLVRIDAREGAHLPEIAEVRPRIVAALVRERGERAPRDPRSTAQPIRDRDAAMRTSTNAERVCAVNGREGPRPSSPTTSRWRVAIL
ncbi:MAG: peptidyl-prolyl cis-trans isomerase, partial [Deltaproteobacteria bacterium]|nr:peptidyl-prolyl cis-trans isomerase [Deltaproteobacteria bacterium]